MALNLSTTLNRRSFILQLAAKASRHRLRGDEAAMMTTLADGFFELGGIYIKFLQGVLLQLPAMRAWKSSHKLDVYEDVPAQPIDLRQLLIKELPPQQLATIANYEVEPFAAGSFGQVYKGVLTNGEAIIIKALRPQARQLLKKDLRLIKFVTKLMASTFTNWNIDLKALVKDFVRSTLAEVDYRAEAAFAHKLHHFYAHNPTIVIPKTYLELCTGSIIVQQYIEGLSVVELLRTRSVDGSYANVVKQRLGSDLSVQLENLGFELYANSLLDRPIHGDPHPGNIRLLPDNKVALLDFGISANPSISPAAYYLVVKEFWRAEYLNAPDPGAMFLSYLRLYSEKLYNSMRVMSTYISEQLHKPIQLHTYIAELGNSYFKRQVSEAQLKEGLDKIRSGQHATDISVNKIINQDNRFQIFAKITDGPLLRAMITYINLATELGYRHLIPQVYNDVMRFVHANLPELEIEKPVTMELDEAVEILYGWLENIGQQDFELYKLLRNYLQGLNL